MVTNRHARFTIYDMMEASGQFERNPANPDSRDESGTALYKGPVKYPMMMYHPEGKERVIRAAEWEDTKGGARLTGEQREIIWQMVNNREEERELLDWGWHNHPAKAIHAGGGLAPPMSSTQRIDDLEAEISRLREERDQQRELLARTSSKPTDPKKQPFKASEPKPEASASPPPPNPLAP